MSIAQKSRARARRPQSRELKFAVALQIVPVQISNENVLFKFFLYCALLKAGSEQDSGLNLISQLLCL